MADYRSRQRQPSGKASPANSIRDTSSLVIGGSRVIGNGPIQKQQSPFNRTWLDQTQSSFRQDLEFLQARNQALSQAIGRRNSNSREMKTFVSTEQMMKRIADECSDPGTVLRREGFSSLEEAVCSQALWRQLICAVHARIGGCQEKMLEKATALGFVGGKRSSVIQNSAIELANGPPFFPALINRFLEVLSSYQETVKKNEDTCNEKINEEQKKIQQKDAEMMNLRQQLETANTKVKDLEMKISETCKMLEDCQAKLELVQAEKSASFEQVLNTEASLEDSPFTDQLDDLKELLSRCLQYLDDGHMYDSILDQANSSKVTQAKSILSAFAELRMTRQKFQQSSLQILKLSEENKRLEAKILLADHAQDCVEELRSRNRSLQTMIDELRLQNDRLQDAQACLHSKINSNKSGRPDIISAFQQIDGVIESEMRFLHSNIHSRLKEAQSQFQSNVEGEGSKVSRNVLNKLC